jgi:hypothetical protein
MMVSWRLCCTIDAVVNPRGTTFKAAEVRAKGVCRRQTGAFHRDKKRENVSMRGAKIRRRARRTSSLELLHLHLAEALDVLQGLLRGVREPLDGVHARLDELLDVRRRDTVFLRGGGGRGVRRCARNRRARIWETVMGCLE